MKKKILFLTNIYPEPNSSRLNNTNVCHYFVKEWVNMNFDVKVIYNYHIYAKILHFLASFFEKLIANKAQSVVNTSRPNRIKKYSLDGVGIVKIPIFKFFPRIRFSQKVINAHLIKILEETKRDNFKPDYIIGHFHNPNLVLINKLKKAYPNAKTCLVIHGDTSNIKRFYKNKYATLIDNIDVWGYRSRAIGAKFEDIYGNMLKSFVCYSGVPESILKDAAPKKINNGLVNFIYVGTLIERKKPLSVLKALILAFNKEDFLLTYVGDGVEKKNIINASKKYKREASVLLIPSLSRESVALKMNQSDCFIMISEKESFGLVYLEAMARGCITIGSREEGIDGVIKHGENGFLCEAGNYKELAALIKSINKLTPKEISKISQNAIATACSLTDLNVAKYYIKKVVEN